MNRFAGTIRFPDCVPAAFRALILRERRTIAMVMKLPIGVEVPLAVEIVLGLDCDRDAF